jgi:hypothetical protein
VAAVFCPVTCSELTPIVGTVDRHKHERRGNERYDSGTCDPAGSICCWRFMYERVGCRQRLFTRTSKNNFVVCVRACDKRSVPVHSMYMYTHTHTHTQTHTYVYRHMTLEHICQFRESIRPLLANVMRQGSENQHPSEVRPVSVSRLTPTGKFRFSNNYI